MFIVGILSWWYTAGLLGRIKSLQRRLAGLIDYFSIDLLATTLFAPFRQISAGRVDGPIAVKWRAFLDRLVSRVIGAIVRTLTIIVGLVAIIFVSAWCVVAVALWLLTPLLPIIGAVMMIIGWTPTWI